MSDKIENDITKPLPPCPDCGGRLSCVLGTPHGDFIWCDTCREKEKSQTQ